MSWIEKDKFPKRRESLELQRLKRILKSGHQGELIHEIIQPVEGAGFSTSSEEPRTSPRK